MDEEQAQRFMRAAQDDYADRVRAYEMFVHGREPVEVERDISGLRAARADVLAAQQVLHLAQNEAQRAAEREQAAIYTCGLCGERTSSLQYVAGCGPGVCEDCYWRDE